MPGNRLVVLPSLKAVPTADGRVVVTEKFIAGMNEYVGYWGGPVSAIIEPINERSNNLDNTAIVPAAQEFGLELLAFDDSRLAEHLADAAVVLGGTDYRQNRIGKLCRRLGVPYVVNTEYTLTTRRQIAAAEERNPLRRWRRYAWERSQERWNVRNVRAAAGVQCNGLPTFREYSPLNRAAMLYFDTRTAAEMLPDEEKLERRLAHLLAGEPLRLAFSGRLIEMKGADHLPPFAAELRRLGVPFHLTIYGAGSLDDALRAAVTKLDLYGQVTFPGAVDFRHELMPKMQTEVDLFICPHRQGDPSCTYLETLACGVPIVGYDNEAWGGLVELSGAGRKVTLDDYSLLASSVARLHADRELTAKLSLRAWDFARNHTFERTFERRIEHLRQCAGMVDADALAASV